MLRFLLLKNYLSQTIQIYRMYYTTIDTFTEFVSISFLQYFESYKKLLQKNVLKMCKKINFRKLFIKNYVNVSKKLRKCRKDVFKSVQISLVCY